MHTYKEYAPSPYDTKGLNLPDRQDWLVVIGRNRDSDCLAECNFNAALERLGGEGDDVEIHQFGHWACGWVEVIIVRPDTLAAVEADQIESDLDGYPVLDEDDFYEREHDAAAETWANYCQYDRIKWLRAHYEPDTRWGGIGTIETYKVHTFADLLGCARGKYFIGEPHSMLGC